MDVDDVSCPGAKRADGVSDEDGRTGTGMEGGEGEIKMKKRRMKSIKAEWRAAVITADLWLPAASQARLSPTLSE